jgi:transcription elongation factor GreB
MSRAFVKEMDENADEPLPPDSPHPLYVTPDGLAELQAKLAALQAETAGELPDEPAERQHQQHLRRDVKILERKIGRAITVEPQPTDKIAIGHVVTVEDDDGVEHKFRIVGEDQADPARGWISWLSPLATALHGSEIDDRVTWQRPAGAVALTVVAIES